MSDSMPWGEINTVPQSQINWATTTREPQHDLDRQAFLNLLITQLKYQDPLNPMDDRDFIAQMAQFSALEQMMNLNATFERTQAYGMIGKIVDATFVCPTSNERIEIEQGLVVSVRRQGSSVLLGVEGANGKVIDVPFDAITEVSEDFLLSFQLQAIHSQVQGQRAADLIGKTVQGFTRVGDNLEFVEGKVDSVLMEGDVAILIIGNQQLVFPRDIFSVVGPTGKNLLGSPYFTHGSEVIGVDIVNNDDNMRMYLQFSNGSRIHVQVINHVIDALTYIGSKVTHGDVVDGVIESITMKNGVPFLNARCEDGVLREVDFLGYIAERTGQPVEKP